MNKLEQFIYNIVKKNPNLKFKIRNAYQSILDLYTFVRSASAYDITIRKGYYFGFHDKSPWSFDNQFLLSNRHGNMPIRMPLKDDKIAVGYFSGDNYENFQRIAETSSFNWQQGCMLQWVGRTHQFIYNDFDGEKNIAHIYDIQGNHIKTLPAAIGAVSPDGKYALSYSFERTNFYSPGYGYSNGTDPELDKERPITHGISIINLQNNEIKQLFSVNDIALLNPINSMHGAFHYLTHCQFSPSGNRFKFFHRWIKDLNVLTTRMISSDLEGKELHIFDTDSMVSHVGWRDNEHILAYSRIKTFGDRYVLFKDKSDEKEIIGAESFTSDGHPSYDKSGRWILTDTYPDRFRTSYLILYDTYTNTRYNLNRLKIPKEFSSPDFFSNWQCDFHPRWDRENRYICFDSAHSGTRSLCTIKLNDDLKRETIKSI